MKKAIIVVSVLVIAAMALWGCATPPEEPTVPDVPAVVLPTEINVGAVHPLTGGCSPAGIQMTAGAQLAVDQINASGGIKAMDGAKLKLVIGDSQSNPDVGATEAERLITREDVVVMMGSYADTIPVTVQCQKYKTPMVCSVMGAHIDKTYDWIFRDFNMMEYDDQEIWGAIKYFTETTGEGPQTIAMLHNDGEWGLTCRSIAKETIAREGWDLVYDDIFPFGGCTDFSSYLIKIKAANPDLMAISMCLPDHTYFSKQVMEAGIDFPYGVMSWGCACEDPVFYESVSQEAVEYMFVQEDCDIWVKNRPFYPYLNDSVEAEIGVPISAYMLCGYGVAWDVKDALERTQYHRDIGMFRSNLRDALTQTDITMDNCPDMITLSDGTTFCPALVRGIDRVKFTQNASPGAKFWQNTYSRGQISQNIDGERIPMYPTVVHPADAPDFVWPIPSWSER